MKIIRSKILPIGKGLYYYWADLSADKDGEIVKYYDSDTNKWLPLNNAENVLLNERLDEHDNTLADHDTRIKKNAKDIADEIIRATKAEADLNTAIQQVAEDLDNFILGEEDLDNVINRWQEVVKFLQGIEEDETLAGIVAQLNKQIADEVTRAKAAEKTNADAITAETARATEAEQEIKDTTVKTLTINRLPETNDKLYRILNRLGCNLTSDSSDLLINTAYINLVRSLYEQGYLRIYVDYLGLLCYLRTLCDEENPEYLDYSIKIWNDKYLLTLRYWNDEVVFAEPFIDFSNDLLNLNIGEKFHNGILSVEETDAWLQEELDNYIRIDLSNAPEYRVHLWLMDYLIQLYKFSPNDIVIDEDYFRTYSNIISFSTFGHTDDLNIDIIYYDGYEQLLKKVKFRNTGTSLEILNKDSIYYIEEGPFNIEVGSKITTEMFTNINGEHPDDLRDPINVIYRLSGGAGNANCPVVLLITYGYDLSIELRYLFISDNNAYAGDKIGYIRAVADDDSWTTFTVEEVNTSIISSLELGETSTTAYAGDKGAKLSDNINLLFANRAPLYNKISSVSDPYVNTIAFGLYAKDANGNIVDNLSLKYVTIPSATTDKAGMMTAADKTNLNSVVSKIDNKADSSALNDYLPLAGGKVTGTTTFETTDFATLLIVKRNDNGAAVTTYLNTTGILGSIGINSLKEPYWSDNVGSFKLWSESNDGTGSGLDADLLDGKDSTYFAAKNYIERSIELPHDNKWYKLATVLNSGIFHLEINSAGTAHDNHQEFIIDTAHVTVNVTQLANSGYLNNADIAVDVDRNVYIRCISSQSSGLHNVRFYSTGSFNIANNITILNPITLMGSDEDLPASNICIGKRGLVVTDISITNDGHNSGIDADTLDTHHADEFLLKSEASAEAILAYGVEWETELQDPVCTRIGNSLLHKSLPIQSAYKGCVVKDGVLLYYLDANDWNYKADGTASVLDGTDGDVMVHTPRFYGKSEIDGSKRRVWISTIQISPDYVEIPEMYVAAYRSTLDREANPVKVASVVNTSTRYRGGANNTSLDEYLATDPFRTVLGKPVTNQNRGTMRTYARNAGAELLSYEQYKWIFYWAYVIEYANFNSQATYIGELTSDGYRQGGLGVGICNLDYNNWSYYNKHNPLTPCGYCNDLGNNTGIKEKVIVVPTSEGATPIYNYTLKIPRWRGFDNPFGDIWTNLDGILIDTPVNVNDPIPTAYIFKDSSKYTDALSTALTTYDKKFTLSNTQNWIREWILGTEAEMLPETTGSNSTGTQYKSDFMWINYDDTPETLLVGGGAHFGALCGLGAFYAYDAVATVNPHFGFRFVIPIQ